MDEIVRAVTKDGFVKISAVTARGVVERAREIHGLSPTASAALGRTLCGASMLYGLRALSRYLYRKSRYVGRTRRRE